MITITQNHLRPVAILTRKSRALDRERRDWLISCNVENIKALKRKTFVNGPEPTGTPEMAFPDTTNRVYPDADGEHVDQTTLSAGPGITAIRSIDEGSTAANSPISSDKQSLESSEKLDNIKIDAGRDQEASAIRQFPSSPMGSGIIDNSANGDLEAVGEACGSDSVFPVKKKKRQARARRLKSDAVRPPKAFIIRFKDPIAVPVRDGSFVDSPDLPSTQGI